MDEVGEVADKATKGAEFVLRHLWTLGFILIFFTGLVIISRENFQLPAAVLEWNQVGLLFGASLICVSLLKSLLKLGWATLRLTNKAVSQIRRSKRASSEALQCFQTLNDRERVALLDLFCSSQNIWKIEPGTVQYDLVDLKILKSTQTIVKNPLEKPILICQLQRSISKKKSELRANLLNTVRSEPFRFQAIAHRYLRRDDFERARLRVQAPPEF